MGYVEAGHLKFVLFSQTFPCMNQEETIIRFCHFLWSYESWIAFNGTCFINSKKTVQVTLWLGTTSGMLSNIGWYWHRKISELVGVNVISCLLLFTNVWHISLIWQWCMTHEVPLEGGEPQVWCHLIISDRADSRFVPSQWETSLQSNAVSQWLGTNLESALS